MAIVIGQGTSITGLGDVCATSAQWAMNPNTQRQYCLGATAAFKSVSKPTQTLSVTIYSEGGTGIPIKQIAASIDCDNSAVETVGVVVAICNSTAGDISHDDWHINSFSYSKEEATSVGQETWSYIRWPSVADTGNPDVIEPSSVLRGIPEGQGTVDTDLDIAGTIPFGVTLTAGTTTIGSQGSVSGGQIGKYWDTASGQVEAIGGVTAGGADTGNASANIPLIPVWF